MGHGIRTFGTMILGESFSVDVRRAVWAKGTPIQGTSPSIARLDICGAIIQWDQYGETADGGPGWEIDHIKPVAKGGTDDLDNLQPLQWQNNRNKSDDYPTTPTRYCKFSRTK